MPPDFPLKHAVPPATEATPTTVAAPRNLPTTVATPPPRCISLWRKIRTKILATVGLGRLHQLRRNPKQPQSSEEELQKEIRAHDHGLRFVVGTKGVQANMEVSTTALRGWATFLISLQLEHIYQSPINTLANTFIASVLGSVWEMAWIQIMAWLHKKLYSRLLRFIAKLPDGSWKLEVTVVMFNIVRLLLPLWRSGKWVSIVYLAMVSPNPQTGFLMRCKIPIPDGLGLRVIAMVVTTITQLCNGLLRRPTRRHGHHESSSLEQPRNRWEPRQL